MIQIRSAQPDQAIEISNLVNSAYRGDSSRQGWTTEADLLGGQRTDPERLVEMMSEPHAQIELAFLDSKLVGCVYLRREFPETLYFGMLVVDPKLQSQGIGKVILNHLEKIAQDSRLRRIRMHVIDARPELIAYYERRGYQKTGVTEAFPENDPRFGIPKVKGLLLTEFAKSLGRE